MKSLRSIPLSKAMEELKKEGLVAYFVKGNAVVCNVEDESWNDEYVYQDFGEQYPCVYFTVDGRAVFLTNAALEKGEEWTCGLAQNKSI